MAKKEKKEKKDASSEEKKPFYRDERFKLVAGVAFIFLAAFLIVSFISYLFTWQADQSFSTRGNTLSDQTVLAENWAGKTGAKAAYWLMDYGFGLASLLLPFIFLMLGLRLMRIRLLPFRRTLRATLFAIILVSLTLGYLTGLTGGYFENGIGGAHGYFVTRYGNALIGKTGTGLFLLLLIVTYLSFTFKDFPSWMLGLLHKWLTPKPKPVVDVKPENLKNSEENPENSGNEDLTKQIDNDNLEIVFQKPEEFDIVPSALPDEPVEMPDDTVDFSVDDTTTQNDEVDELRENILKELGPYDARLELSTYKFPGIDLLEDHKSGNPEVTNEELISNKNKIVETLGNYKIQIAQIKATIGPTVTLYEIIPAPGIRISKIKSLEDDIALSLSALGIRIIAPIPGRGTIGIEVPNRNPEVVSMKSVIASKKFQEATYDLPIVLGKTISNETYAFDLAKMPHLLIAGATGQGKSVGLNAILTSLLYKKHPAELKFVLIDPKKVELTLYSRIEKHYLAKLPDTEEAIITDTQKVIHTLQSLTIEMDTRYDLLKKAHVRNIKEYNTKFSERKLNPENGHRYLPYIVLIIDEFADLIMTAGREIETPIARLAQLARAIGIHLIIATQRPTTNIITGVIKANFPARIAFRVTSMIDSRTILDSPGANQLIGRGDMLISNGSDLIRIQCAFVDTDEIEKITSFIADQRSFPTAHYLPEVQTESNEDLSDVDLNKRDILFDEAARLIVMNQQGSTSLIQRKFSIGYNRAGRLMDQLEAAGIVGASEGSKARQVLIVDEISLEHILSRFNEKE